MLLVRRVLVEILTFPNLGTSAHVSRKQISANLVIGYVVKQVEELPVPKGLPSILQYSILTKLPQDRFQFAIVTCSTHFYEENHYIFNLGM